MKQAIELRRIRDFGQIVNDTFTFFKENIKPLLRILFILCGLFILIGIVATIFTYLNVTSVFNFDPNTYDGERKSFGFFLTIFLSTFAILIAQAFIHLTTLCYISVYLQKNNNTPTLAEVWGYFRFYFFRVLFSSILLAILFAIGFILCVIPGIYLMPVFYLVIPVMVMENSSFGYAFNKSFRIIKNHWWMVFGVVFVMSVIVWVVNSCVGIPLGLITSGSKFLTLQTFKLPLVILFSIMRNMLLLIYVLPAIAVSLCYFTLAEEKDGTGLLDRIDKLGKTDGDAASTLPAEEY